MGRYRILIKPAAVKEIERIPNKKDRQRIVRRISGLRENPRPTGCEKLSGQEKYRIRQGRYRMAYGIDEKESAIYVVKIGRRKAVYR